MGNIIQPCKVALRSCTIKGIPVTPHVQAIDIQETMCKPYITATIAVNDSGNIINNLKLRGGEEVTFSIDNGMTGVQKNGKDWSIYDSTQYILSIDETELQSNYRTMYYTIRTASESFFKNRANIVQNAYNLVPGTSAASQIHNQYVGGDVPLRVLMSSLGLIAKQESGGYNTNNKKPFKAIKDLIENLSYGAIQTGSTVYFRDRDSYVMAPLEYLFMTMGSQETFEQRQTWGQHWTDTFTTYNAIIHATTKINEDQGKQRGAISNITAATSGMINVFDRALGQEVAMSAVGAAAAAFSAAAGVGDLKKFVTGRMGGLPNVHETDSRRLAPGTDQQINMVAQNAFQAKVKDGTNYYIKVPVQTGFNVTVGQGITAKLLPPIGDSDKNSANYLDNQMLVAEVNHECYFDDREVMGTTTMRGVQIGYNT